MSSKVYFAEIALIRPVLIFSIIIGHAFAVFTDSLWWPLPIGMHTNYPLSCINPIMISFALQTFVFVSGFLFAHKSDMITASESKKTILGKFKRIYVPSLIFSTVYIVCFESLNVGSIYEVLNGAGHLWFLPMLFWCYTFGVLTINLLIKPTLIRFSVLVIISVLALYLPDYFRIASGLHYFLYFVIGAWVFKYKDNFLRFHFNKPIKMIYGWMLISLLCFIKCYLTYFCDLTIPIRLLSLSKILVNIVLGIVGAFTLYFSADYIITKFPNIKSLRGDIWYGMYIYHQFCMIYLYYYTKLPEYLGNNVLFLVLLISIVVSLLLVLFTLKTKFGSWLIG